MVNSTFFFILIPKGIRHEKHFAPYHAQCQGKRLEVVFFPKISSQEQETVIKGRNIADRINTVPKKHCLPKEKEIKGHNPQNEYGEYIDRINSNFHIKMYE